MTVFADAAPEVRDQWHAHAAAVAAKVLQAGTAIFIIVSAIVLAAGSNPLSVAWNITRTPFESIGNLEQYLLALTPLLLVSCGLAIAFRGGLYNIGADGQMIAGAVVGAGVGIELEGAPRLVGVVIVLVVGALGGAAWGALSGYLRGRHRVSEVLSSLLLIFVADFILRYLVRDPWRDGFLPQSARLPESTQLPDVPGLDVHIGLPIALVLVPTLWALLEHTTFGFRLQALGAGEEVARANGIAVARTATIAMALSGACAGMAGIIQAVAIEGRLVQSLNSGLGFTAIVVVLVARMRALGVLLASAFVVMLTVGGETVQRSDGLSAFIVPVIQAVAILVVLVMDRRIRS